MDNFMHLNFYDEVIKIINKKYLTFWNNDGAFCWHEDFLYENSNFYKVYVENYQILSTDGDSEVSKRIKPILIILLYELFMFYDC